MSALDSSSGEGSGEVTTELGDLGKKGLRPSGPVDSLSAVPSFLDDHSSLSFAS